MQREFKGEIMAIRNALIIFLLGWFMASSHYVIRSHRLSTEEDSELERQLKLLNKPAVTTIQTKYGDLYDCVDFYQQPAFDHPLLKDHKYEFKMRSYNHELNRRTNTDIYDTDTFDIWSNGKGCPSNTVPIRRITKQDLIKANRAAELRYNISLDLNPGVEVAMLRTTQQNKYYGGGMDVAVYHPAVQSTQYSSSHVKVENGPDSISVGWTVNPSLYPDNETRMFIYTTTKDSYCYNTYCPGFIISTTEVPIDLLLKPYTQIGGPLYEKKFFLRKDAANGDWFLVIGRTNITVGSWPQKIFTALADSANYVEWGGEVYSPPGTDPPPMGAGQKLQQKLYSDCYGRQVNLIDENHEIDHDPPSCETYQSSKRYQVIDEGFDAGPGIGRLIFFGGP